jgi:hypothetical protein
MAGRRRRYVRPGRLFLVLSLALFAVIRFTTDAPRLATVDEVSAGSATLAVKRSPRQPDRRSPGFDVDEDFNLSLGKIGGDAPWLDPLRRRLAGFNALTRQQKSEHLFGGMVRFGPYAMVALLPLFAALMMLAYAGRARVYPGRPDRYAAHLAYGAHTHAFACLVIAAMLLVPWGPVRWLLAAWTAIYLLASMKRVYGGRWSGVMVRAGLVTISYLFCFAFAMLLLIVAAVTLG